MRLFLWLSLILVFVLTLVEAGKNKKQKSKEKSLEQSSEENSSEEKKIADRNRTVTSTVSSIPRVRNFRRTTPLRKSARTSSHSQSSTRTPTSVFENVSSTASANVSPQEATVSPSSEQNGPAETSMEPSIAHFTSEVLSDLLQSTDTTASPTVMTVTLASNSEQRGPGKTSTALPVTDFVEDNIKEVSTKATDSTKTVTQASKEQKAPSETSTKLPIVDFTREEPTQPKASSTDSLTIVSSVKNPSEEEIHNYSSSLTTGKERTTGTPINGTTNRETTREAIEHFNYTITEPVYESFTQNTSNNSDVGSDTVGEFNPEITANSTFSDDHDGLDSTSAMKSETVPPTHEGRTGQENATTAVEENSTNSTTETSIVSNVSTTRTSKSDHSNSETQRTTDATEENESFTQSTSKISDVEFVSFKKDVTEILENSTFSSDHRGLDSTSIMQSETVLQEESNGEQNETTTVEEIITRILGVSDGEEVSLVNSNTETGTTSNVSTMKAGTADYSISETQRTTDATEENESFTQNTFNISDPESNSDGGDDTEILFSDGHGTWNLTSPITSETVQQTQEGSNGQTNETAPISTRSPGMSDEEETSLFSTKSEAFAPSNVSTTSTSDSSVLDYSISETQRTIDANEENEDVTQNSSDISDDESNSDEDGDTEVLENSTFSDYEAWNSTSMMESEAMPQPNVSAASISDSETQRTGTTREYESVTQNTSGISDVQFVSKREDVNEILENSTFSDDLEAWNLSEATETATMQQEESNSQANETVTVEVVSTQNPGPITGEKANSMNSGPETSIASYLPTTSSSFPPTFAYSVSETQRNIGAPTSSPAPKGHVQQRNKSGLFLFLPF